MRPARVSNLIQRPSVIARALSGKPARSNGSFQSLHITVSCSRKLKAFHVGSVVCKLSELQHARNLNVSTWQFRNVLSLSGVGQGDRRHPDFLPLRIDSLPPGFVDRHGIGLL
jgi:hypothetical protein